MVLGLNSTTCGSICQNLIVVILIGGTLERCMHTECRMSRSFILTMMLSFGVAFRNVS